MEMWEGQTYRSLMEIPRSRRYRFVLKKIELEQDRTNRHKAEMSKHR